MRGAFLGIGVMIVFIVLFFSLLIVLSSNQRHNCQQIEDLKTQVRISIDNSSRRLPKIAYYRQHPKELKEALKENNSLVQRFAATTCNGYFS
jgi:ribosomal protein L18